MSAKSRPCSQCGMFSKKCGGGKKERGNRAEIKNNTQFGASSPFQVLTNRRLYPGLFLGNKMDLRVCL